MRVHTAIHTEKPRTTGFSRRWSAQNPHRPSRRRAQIITQIGFFEASELFETVVRRCMAEGLAGC